MRLENLTLINFKNYKKQSFKFSPQVNCIVGENGSGKTNLLDSIHYLTLTKSAFNAIDSQNIRYDQDFFTIKGKFEKNHHHHQLQCTLKRGEKKILKHNQKVYEKLKDHIGAFPMVLIAPHDVDIIREGSELRRKFFDGIISQVDQFYLNILITYYHNLKQRNSLLRQFQERNYFDPDLVEPYNHQLLDLGQKLFHTRRQFIDDYKPLFTKYYHYISGLKENTDLVYLSDFSQPEFPQTFIGSINKDLALLRTNLGSHKDDYHFTIEGHSLKKFASQGQQKSYLIALKLAQYDYMKKSINQNPLLLLDDIFAKLDDIRMERMIDMILKGSFGQIFITDARPHQISEVLNKFKVDVNYFHLKK